MFALWINTQIENNPLPDKVLKNIVLKSQMQSHFDLHDNMM